jgi:hypothetical protein
MVVCMLRAVAAGLATAIIIAEALLAGLQVFTGGAHAHAMLASGTPLPAATFIAVSTIWLIGGILGGALAAAMTGWRLVGWLVGMLLGLPLGLLLLLAELPWAVTSIAALPLAGAVAGAALARRTMTA